jgi:hypothetical protein
MKPSLNLNWSLRLGWSLKLVSIKNDRRKLSLHTTMGIIDNPTPKNLKQNSIRMPRIQPKKNILPITNLKLQDSFSNIPQL